MESKKSRLEDEKTEMEPKNAVFGMASGLLSYADKSYEALEQFVEAQIEGLKLANAYLTINE